MTPALDPFDPAARLTHFKRAAQHDAAVKLLAVLVGAVGQRMRTA